MTNIPISDENYIDDQIRNQYFPSKVLKFEVNYYIYG